MTRSSEKVTAHKYLRIIYFLDLRGKEYDLDSEFLWLLYDNNSILDFYGVFQGPRALYIAHIIHSNHNHTAVVVSYMCSYNCPGAKWRKRSSQSAPLTTTSTNIHKRQ